MSIEMKLMRHCLEVLLVACIVSVAPVVHAEQADRTKQVQIEYDLVELDDVKRVFKLEGNVILTQGTMRLTAERMVVKEDDAGYQTALAFSGPKGQVAFRQKREGSAEFMEGFADRAEFDEKADTLKLMSRARLKNGRDELKAEYIYYNSATEVMQARNAIPDAKGNSTPAAAATRPTITIQPKIADEKSKPAAPPKVE